VKKAIQYLVLAINFVAIAALLVSYTAIFIPPDKFWIPSILGLAFPFLLVGNLIFIGFWLFVKPRYIFFSLLTVLLGLVLINRYVQFVGKTTNKEGIKIVSYNVKFFAGDKGSSPKVNADKIIAFLNSQNADIICLQEARLRKNNIFNASNAVSELKSIRHYHYARSSLTFGAVTFTRYPIINMGEIRHKDSQNISIYTDVLIGRDTVRIFNIHLQSYKIDPRKYAIIDSPGISEEEDFRQIREIGSKLKRAFQIRAGQVREIRKIIEDTPYPVIICGDFNDTPVSYAYQQLRGNCNDAFVSSGRGFGLTYIGKAPSYRIDNIFHSKSFESYDFRGFDFRMSDHLPVSCTLIQK